MSLQINGKDVNNHFGTNISSKIEDAENFWISLFNKNYDALVKK